MIAIAAFLIILILAAALTTGALLQKLVSTLRTFEARIAKLEEGQRTRNPWNTNDGLEDAMSVSWDVIHRAAETIDYAQRRAEQINAILQVIRSNPSQYDGDRPNQKITKK